MCFLAMISFSYGFRLSWNFEWYNRCRHEVCWALVIDCNPHSFPPTKVEIEVEPQNPVVGRVANLKCKSDSSSPEVKMIWYRNNEALSGAADARTGSGNYGGQGWILWQKLKNWHFKFGSIWFTNVELLYICIQIFIINYHLFLIYKIFTSDGGVMTSSVLQTKVTEADINAVYKCEAGHMSSSKSISNSTKIPVLCKYSYIFLIILYSIFY